MAQHAIEPQPTLTKGSDDIYFTVMITVKDDQWDMVVRRDMPLHQFVDILNQLYGTDTWRINA